MYKVVCDMGDCPQTDSVSSIQICDGCPFNYESITEKGNTIVFCTFDESEK